MAAHPSVPAPTAHAGEARIRALIVDDEPLARRGLELRLAQAEGVEIVGQCGDGASAIAAVHRLQPDVMFLDVQMPGADGFDTLRAIPASAMPLVVFVTAYDHFALRAFEAAAIDYLLKPVDDERLSQALDRVRHELAQRASGTHCAQLLRLLGELDGRGPLTLEQALDPAYAAQLRRDNRLVVREGGRIVRVDLDSLRWIDAAGDYMCLHIDGETLVLRATMSELERQLDPRRFARIHRSTIVNLRRVVEMRPHTNGESFLRLDCGQELKLSRSYRDKLALLMA
ncbi:LytR/AlgR family response regulator transcription factor [Vulcaniibacterium thermophilum]|uniref:DNA-binding response regulator n=1 Tax=Vulcaniibacterium thermophilum TaxID=1169913 RepID=A0A919DCG0_9GAMM|nr:LytTR family DNA-binding domain-containing protein [Vulcaniibacterium thermophilum]GHE34470.1 DNA-binding response regulator [Vulcaniibacterium thermophilum]